MVSGAKRENVAFTCLQIRLGALGTLPLVLRQIGCGGVIILSKYYEVINLWEDCFRFRSQSVGAGIRPAAIYSFNHDPNQRSKHRLQLESHCINRHEGICRATRATVCS